MSLIDTFGVPEYFCPMLGAIEDAGDGMIRIVRCISRNGVLIPVVSCIIPAHSVLQVDPVLREVALKMACIHSH
jgi:hypothetical protein